MEASSKEPVPVQVESKHIELGRFCRRSIVPSINNAFLSIAWCDTVHSSLFLLVLFQICVKAILMFWLFVCLNWHNLIYTCLCSWSKYIVSIKFNLIVDVTVGFIYFTLAVWEWFCKGQRASDIGVLCFVVILFTITISDINISVNVFFLLLAGLCRVNLSHQGTCTFWNIVTRWHLRPSNLVTWLG